MPKRKLQAFAINNNAVIINVLLCISAMVLKIYSGLGYHHPSVWLQVLPTNRELTENIPNWQWLGKAGRGWNGLDLVGIGWNELKWAGMSWNSLELAGIGWNRLE